MRRGLAWGVAIPLMLAGSQAAHVLAYRWVYPEAHVRARTLLATGHAYLTLLPLVLGIAGAAVLVSLAVSALDAARGRSARGLPALAFGILPPLAFLFQEVLELSLHSGTFAWHAVAAPTFVPGLLLQLPFTLAAYVMARLLLRAATHIGRAFAAPPTPRRRRLGRLCAPAGAHPGERDAALRRTSRGPPRVAVV
jgi:hypothetical protein